MTRTFAYTFTPAYADPLPGPTVELTVQEVEDAGIREVLQTPGAALGSWALLDALLEPSGDGTPFLFQEPLGRAREVKVALSGLFGRFVARAYVERYFGLSIFLHVVPDSELLLHGRRRIQIRRLASGDLPDWVACTPNFSRVAVVEAKGCYAASGPNQALRRAWDQANRIDLAVGRRQRPASAKAIGHRDALGFSSRRRTGSAFGGP